jgi:hypothetical protein
MIFLSISMSEMGSCLFVVFFFFLGKSGIGCSTRFFRDLLRAFRFA